LEGDDGALGVLALAGAEPRAAGLAAAGEGVHRVHLDVEDLLDGELDLGLVGTRVDHEGVLAVVDQAVALLGDHRRGGEGARVLVGEAHFSSPPFCFATKASSAALVKTMSSLTSTS